MASPAEIVLRPVDDYVAEFTEELSLTRVITAGDLLVQGQPATVSGPTIDAATTLDDLIPQIAGGTAGFVVQDENGAPLGHLQASQIVEVLKQDRARRRAV